MPEDSEVKQAKFVFFAPKCVMKAVEGSLVTLTQELVDYIETLKKPVPEFWAIGVDEAQQALVIQPSVKTSFGSLFLERKSGEEPTFRSRQLVDWLVEMGVPAEVPVEWDVKAGMIVGDYESVATAAERIQEEPAQAQPAVNPDDQPIPYEPIPMAEAEQPQASMPEGFEVAAPPSKRKGGRQPGPKNVKHDWQPTLEKTPTGRALLVCKVCGLYTTDPFNPDSRTRPCHPGLYEGCYEHVDDVVTPIRGAISARIATVAGEAAGA